jgi:hypothetical protein
VIVPALVWLAIAGWTALTARFDAAAALLVTNVAVFVVWLPVDAYIDLRTAYRVLVPIVISSLLLLPRLRHRLRDDLLFGAVFSLTLPWAVIASWLALMI